MSDFAAGMGQGFMNLGNLFFGILQQRMQAGFEDAQAEKRLKATNAAQLELQKALDAYNEGRVAGSRPMMGPADQGPPQPMMQDVGPSGTPIGAPRPMRADERYGFDASIEAGRAKAYKDQLDMEKTQSEIEENRAQADRYRKTPAFRGASPKSKGKPDLAMKDLTSVHARLSPEDQAALEQEVAKAKADIPDGADPEVVERMWRSLMEKYAFKANSYQSKLKQDKGTGGLGGLTKQDIETTIQRLGK